MFNGHYNEWNNSRMNGIAKYITPGFFESKSLLELGCGHAHWDRRSINVKYGIYLATCIWWVGWSFVSSEGLAMYRIIHQRTGLSNWKVEIGKLIYVGRFNQHFNKCMFLKKDCAEFLVHFFSVRNFWCCGSSKKCWVYCCAHGHVTWNWKNKWWHFVSCWYQL